MRFLPTEVLVRKALSHSGHDCEETYLVDSLKMWATWLGGREARAGSSVTMGHSGTRTRTEVLDIVETVQHTDASNDVFILLWLLAEGPTRCVISWCTVRMYVCACVCFLPSDRIKHETKWKMNWINMDAAFRKIGNMVKYMTFAVDLLMCCVYLKAINRVDIEIWYMSDREGKMTDRAASNKNRKKGWEWDHLTENLDVQILWDSVHVD